MSSFPKIQQPNYTLLILTDGNEHDIPASYFVGAWNLATSAQTANVAIYDGTVAGGTQVDSANALAISGAAQQHIPPQPGISLQTGTLGIKASAAPTSPGIAIAYIP